jgi:hypothetical protein
MVSPAAALRASAEAKSRQTAVKASSTRNRAISVVKKQDSFTRESSTLLPPKVQAAMRVSSPTDPAEREAVAVGSAVARMAVPPAAAPAAVAKAATTKTPPRTPSGPSRMHSALLPAAGVQREGKGPPAATQEVATEIQASLGGGQPLPQAVRDFMEPRFQADFDRVRIHTDDRAAGLAARLSATAFTYGRDIFFAKGAYSPDSAGGRELIAHELTHTIQQRAAVQREEVQREAAPAVTQSAPPQVQRLGFDTAKRYFAEKANALPGFRMMTIVLGKNPINDVAVDSSPRNIFLAIVEFIPGAGLVTQAIENAGIFAKIALWAYNQLKGVISAFGSLGQSVVTFLKTIGPKDIAAPMAAVARGVHLITDPINQIKSLAAGFIDAILEFVKEAILRPLGKLAEGTPSYDLLKGVMGEDPVTGDAVDNPADMMVGGFMKIIGQDEVYNNIKKSNALDKCWAWMQGAWGALKDFVSEIPGLFIEGLKSLTIADIIVVPMAFAKLAKVFGNFLGRFISWAGDAMWKLLEIVFQAVSPGAWTYVQKTGAALKSILMDPAPFVGNLIAAAKGGFSAFGGNFLKHLQKGLIDWLTGSLDGVYIPKALSLGEIIKFAFSVLGLTYARFKPKLVKAFGATTVALLEKGAAVVVKLANEGPAAAWEQMKADLAALKDQVVEGIKGLIIEAVITRGIPKLVAMFIPGAGFIGLIMTVIDTVQTIQREIKRIWSVVTGFIDSIVAIANGNIGAAVSKVESILASGLSLAINFFAQFAGLGKVASKINGILQKVRAPIDGAMDKLIGWIKKMVKGFIDKLAGKDAPPEEKQKRVEKAAKAGAALVNRFAGKPVGDKIIRPLLTGVRILHKVTTLEPVEQGNTWGIKAEINPVFVSQTKAQKAAKTCSIEFVYEAVWPLEEFNSKVRAFENVLNGKTKDIALQTRPPASSKGAGKKKRKSTAELRQGGQAAFRGVITAFIADIKNGKVRKAATDLMSQLQADHQVELQVGGNDEVEKEDGEDNNFAMIQSKMNGSMGSQLNHALNKTEIGPDTKITKVTADRKAASTPAAKKKPTKSPARELQTLLLNCDNKSLPKSVIESWFKL